MESGEVVLLVAMIVIAVVAQVYDRKRRDRQVKAMLDYYKASMGNHQEWLFNQLYALGPGKVLRPDEFEPKTEAAPAKVYSPVEDPMAEFTGLKDDWHA